MSDHSVIINKLDFIEGLDAKLVSLFERSKLGEKLVTDKARLEGYMAAGKSLGVITHQEGMDIMEKAHIKVFGETMAERKANNSRLRQAIDSEDFDYVEIPAIERRR